MSSQIKFIFMLCACASALARGQSQLHIDEDEFTYTATFYETRLSEHDLRALLPFSPYDMYPSLEINSQRVTIGYSRSRQKLQKGLIGDALEVCIDGAPVYLPCGTRDISDPNFFANAEVNVRRNEHILAALDRFNVPAELEVVLRQFRDSMEFTSTIERRRLEYLQTGDSTILSQPIRGLEPLSVCAKEVEALEAATTPEQKYHLSRIEWSNCLSSAWDKAEPPYPVRAWENFLRAYGIVERYTPKAVD